MEATAKSLDAKVDQLQKAISGITINARNDPGGTQTVGLDKGLSCPPGEAISALNLVLGGTCHTQCDPDGHPIKAITVTCSALQAKTQ
jgi:hypothetical protein